MSAVIRREASSPLPDHTFLSIVVPLSLFMSDCIPLSLGTSANIEVSGKLWVRIDNKKRTSQVPRTRSRRLSYSYFFVHLIPHPTAFTVSGEGDIPASNAFTAFATYVSVAAFASSALLSIAPI